MLGSDPKTDWYVSIACFVCAMFLVTAIDAIMHVKLTSITSTEITPGSETRIPFQKRDAVSLVEKLHQKDSTAESIPRSLMIDPEGKIVKEASLP